MTTYRERRERRAERLREWGEHRERESDGMRESARAMVAMIPLGQPIHGQADRSRREKSFARYGRAIEHGQKGEAMQSRADEIERQAANAIYDDDPDAIERLTAKLAGMEAERERIKTENAAFRKANREALKGRTAYERECAMPHASYKLRNLGGQITTARQRLTRLEREKVTGPRDRLITARFASECAECGAALTKGDTIRFNRQAGARCAVCPTEEG